MSRKIYIFLILLLARTAFAPTLKPFRGRTLNHTGRYARGLVGCWLMNEGSGKIIADLSGNGNDGTLAGDTHWVSGKYGPALSFDGTGDVVAIGTNSKLGFTSEDFTLYIYFKITDSSVSKWLYSKGLANDDGFYVQARSDNKIRVATCQNGAQQETETSTLFQDNVWHSLFVVRKGNKIYIYLNSVECSYLAQPEITNPDDASARTAYISGYAAGYGIIGLIDHAAIWNGRALTAAEISLFCREPFCFMADDLPASMMYDYSGAAPSGQVIMIQTAAIPLLFITTFLFIRKRRNGI